MRFQVGTGLAMNPLLRRIHFLSQTIDGRPQPLLKQGSIRQSTATRVAFR